MDDEAVYTSPTPRYTQLEALEVDHVLDILGEEAFHIAKAKGWWPEPKSPRQLVQEYLDRGGPDRESLEQLVHDARQTAGTSEAQLIALAHAELSEALEEVRRGEHRMSTAIPQYKAVVEELADVVLRVLNHAHGKSYDLAGAIRAKMEYNRTRPKYHGGKRF